MSHPLYFQMISLLSNTTITSTIKTTLIYIPVSCQQHFFSSPSVNLVHPVSVSHSLSHSPLLSLPACLPTPSSPHTRPYRTESCFYLGNFGHPSLSFFLSPFMPRQSTAVAASCGYKRFVPHQNKTQTFISTLYVHHLNVSSVVYCFRNVID